MTLPDIEAADQANSTPARVARITAKGVLDEFNYEIDFEDESESGRLRLIYAPNGQGKTNFLRAVNAILNPSFDALQTLVEIPVADAQISLSGGGKLRFSKAAAFDGSYQLTATPPSGDPIQLDVEPSDFGARLSRRMWAERKNFTPYVELVSRIAPRGLLIGDDRLVPLVGDPRSPDWAEDQYSAGRRRSVNAVTRLLGQVERTLTQAAFAGLSHDSSTAGVYANITRATLQGSNTLTTGEARSQLEAQIRQIMKSGKGHERYGLLSLRQLEQISRELRSARQNNRQLPSLYRILKPYLDSLEKQIASLNPAHQLIDTFVTAVNEFLDRKELRFNVSGGIELRGRKGQTLDPESLSSGERHLLYLISNAIQATVDRPLVIIDEPELSLGLEWQRGLLPALLRCTSAGAIQFLIASHSVQVMGTVENVVRPTEA